MLVTKEQFWGENCGFTGGLKLVFEKLLQGLFATAEAFNFLTCTMFSHQKTFGRETAPLLTRHLLF